MQLARDVSLVRCPRCESPGWRHAARHYLVELERAAHDAAVGEGVLRVAHLRRAVEAYRAHDEQFAEGLRARLDDFDFAIEAATPLTNIRLESADKSPQINLHTGLRF